MRFLLSKLRIFLFFPIPYLSQPLIAFNNLNRYGTFPIGTSFIIASGRLCPFNTLFVFLKNNSSRTAGRITIIRAVVFIAVTVTLAVAVIIAITV